MQIRTLIGIGLAALSGIGFGAGGIAAQYLFTYCRRSISSRSVCSERG